MQFKSILMSLMVLFVLFSFVSFAYGEEVNVDRFDIRKSSDLPLDETEILEMVEKNTPAIDPKNFEIMKSSNATLASYGELPSKSGVDSYNWHLLLLQITGSVQNNTELEKYGYADGGSIIGYGARYTDGFVHVKVDKERSSLLTQNDLDTIYAIFEKHANEYGVKNLPLIIARDNQIEYTLAPSDAVRPIIGGLQAEGVVHNNSTGIGTIGYPVNWNQ